MLTGINYIVIHHNSFINNRIPSSQSSDDENNIWYDINILEVNFWLGWIVVSDYSIDGTAGSVDPYPLSSPVIVKEYLPYIWLFGILILLCIVFLPNLKRRELKQII